MPGERVCSLLTLDWSAGGPRSTRASTTTRSSRRCPPTGRPAPTRRRQRSRARWQAPAAARRRCREARARGWPWWWVGVQRCTEACPRPLLGASAWAVWWRSEALREEGHGLMESTYCRLAWSSLSCWLCLLLASARHYHKCTHRERSWTWRCWASRSAALHVICAWRRLSACAELARWHRLGK